MTRYSAKQITEMERKQKDKQRLGRIAFFFFLGFALTLIALIVVNTASGSLMNTSGSGPGGPQASSCAVRIDRLLHDPDPWDRWSTRYLTFPC